MPVIDNDRLVGLISAENISELIMLRNADEASRATICTTATAHRCQ